MSLREGFFLPVQRIYWSTLIFYECHLSHLTGLSCNLTKTDPHKETYTCPGRVNTELFLQ